MKEFSEICHMEGAGFAGAFFASFREDWNETNCIL
jgi:hypothetical protein